MKTQEEIEAGLRKINDDELVKVQGGAIGYDKQLKAIKVFDENTGEVFAYFMNTNEGFQMAVDCANKLGLSTTKVYD